MDSRSKHSLAKSRPSSSNAMAKTKAQPAYSVTAGDRKTEAPTSEKRTSQFYPQEPGAKSVYRYGLNDFTREINNPSYLDSTDMPSQVAADNAGLQWEPPKEQVLLMFNDYVKTNTHAEGKRWPRSGLHSPAQRPVPGRHARSNRHTPEKGKTSAVTPQPSSRKMQHGRQPSSPFGYTTARKVEKHQQSGRYLPATVDKTALKETIVKMAGGRSTPGRNGPRAGGLSKDPGSRAAERVTIMTELALEKRTCKCCRVIQQTAHKCTEYLNQKKASPPKLEQPAQTRHDEEVSMLLPTIDGFQPSARIPHEDASAEEEADILFRFKPFYEDGEQFRELITKFKDINTAILRNIEPLGAAIKNRKQQKVQCKQCKEYERVIHVLYELLRNEQAVKLLVDLE